MSDYKKDGIETSSWDAQDFDAIEREFQEVSQPGNLEPYVWGLHHGKILSVVPLEAVEAC
jgi:hypothetical protein